MIMPCCVPLSHPLWLLNNLLSIDIMQKQYFAVFISSQIFSLKWCTVGLNTSGKKAGSNLIILLYEKVKPPCFQYFKFRKQTNPSLLSLVQ